MLVVHDNRQRRCQNGLDEINERRLRRRGVLRDLRREQKTDGRAADADMAQKQRRLERKTREKRHLGKEVEPDRTHRSRNCRNFAKQQDRQHFKSAEQDVEIRDHNAAKPTDTQLAERAI